MAIYSKINGIWTEQDNFKFKINGEWNDIDSGYVKVDGTWEKFYFNAPYFCVQAATNSATTIGFDAYGTATATLQYSLDKCTTWNSYTLGTDVTLQPNVKCYWKGDNNSFSSSRSNFIHFRASGYVNTKGNIMSLLDSTCQLTDLSNHGNYVFTFLFAQNTYLLSAPELPATSLTYRCYYSMFGDCTALIMPPALLPAMTLATNCYDGMFYGCTSLTTAPELPATTLARNCYADMFYGCTSLTVPPELPATTFGGANVYYGCYERMFYGCTSLTVPPELPATTLADDCYYYMFYGCTSLTTVPKLPATTLADDCYAYMFSGCTSLYVSDTSGTGYDKAWKIPTNGTFTNTYSQSGMFTSCLGTRSSDNMAGTSGQSYTYYTQNTPV